MTNKKFLAGGSIHPDRHVYIQRKADVDVIKNLRNGQHVNVHCGRQGGKTSLMLCVRDQLRSEGWTCIDQSLVKFWGMGQTFVEGLKNIITDICQKLEIDIDLGSQSWGSDERSGITYFIELLLKLDKQFQASGESVLICWDEVDIMTTYRLETVALFFLSLREFCQSAETQIKFMLVSVLTPTEMILEYNTGGVSINCFANIALESIPNSPEVRREIKAQAFPNFPADEMELIINDLLDISGGQPYLFSFMGRELQDRDAPNWQTWDSIKADILESPCPKASPHFDGFKTQFRAMANQVYAMLSTYRRILNGEQVSMATGGDAATLLFTIALLTLDKQGFLRIANPIYKKRINLEWIRSFEKELVLSETHKQYNSTESRSNKNIALILCGGTIGMVTAGGKSGFKGAEQVVQQFIDQELSRLAEVTPIALYQFDGINVSPNEWIGIARWISDNWAKYDAFIVAHGTDTLAYTASAVSYMLGRVNKPVLFTGAQTTLDQPHGDARHNLQRAVFVASHDEAPKETCIFFNDVVLRAVRAEKADDRLYQGFRSPGWPVLARVTEYLLLNKTAWLSKHTGAPKPILQLSPNILSITIEPGIRPHNYQNLLEQVNVKVDGLLIKTPGVGNLPSRGEQNFLPLIRYTLEQKKIPILIVSMVPINPFVQQQYELASIPTQYGAIHAGNITGPAAFTKFAWLVGQTPPDATNPIQWIGRQMKQDVVGESGEFADQTIS